MYEIRTEISQDGEYTSTFLKDKITELVKEIKNEPNMALTKEVAKKIFNTSPQKAELFFRLASAWEPFAQAG